MPVGNETNHTLDGLTVQGGLAVRGSGSATAYVSANATGGLLVNGLPVAGSSDPLTFSGLLPFAPPRIDILNTTVVDLITAGSITANAQTVTHVPDNTYATAVASREKMAMAFGIDITGTWVGTIEFELSNDGTTWSAATVRTGTDPASGATQTNTTVGGPFAVLGTYNAFRVRASAWTSGTATIKVFGTNLGLLPNRDYIINCKASIPFGLVNYGGVRVFNGHNVILIGGEFDGQYVNTSTSDKTCRGMYFTYQTGVVHLEGWYIHGVDVSDGMILESTEATIQIQNVRIGNRSQPVTAHDVGLPISGVPPHSIGTSNGFSDKHSDCIESEFGPRELRLYNVDGFTNYQGLMLGQNGIKHGGHVWANRINFVGVNTNTSVGGRQIIWASTETGRVTFGPECYIEPHTEQTHFNVYVDIPSAMHWYGTPTFEPNINQRQIVTGGTLTVPPVDSRAVTEVMWPPQTNIAGRIKLGPPPNGDFALTAGLTYQSPGYAGREGNLEASTFENGPFTGAVTRPIMNRMRAWTGDPTSILGAMKPPTSGRIYLAKIPVEYSLYEVRGFRLIMEAEGSGLTIGQNWVGLYGRSSGQDVGGNGAQLMLSADCTDLFSDPNRVAAISGDLIIPNNLQTPSAQPPTQNDIVLTGNPGQYMMMALLCTGSVLPTFAAHVSPWDGNGGAVSDSVLAARLNVGVFGYRKALYTTRLTGINNDLLFTAKANSETGNHIQIAYVDPGGVTATATCVVTGSTGTTQLITINLGRAASAINTTANDVKTLIAGNGTATAAVTVVDAAGNNGTGLVTALAASADTYLRGGSMSSSFSPTDPVNIRFAANATTTTLPLTIGWATGVHVPSGFGYWGGIYGGA